MCKKYWKTYTKWPSAGHGLAGRSVACIVAKKPWNPPEPAGTRPEPAQKWSGTRPEPAANHPKDSWEIHYFRFFSDLLRSKELYMDMQKYA